MAKISKASIDSAIRATIFDELGLPTNENYHKINERQYGTLMTDENGVERYARIAIIVAEEREDMTAVELMNAEIAAYEATQAKKAERAAARAEKAAKDKAKREEAARKAAETKAE